MPCDCHREDNAEIQRDTLVLLLIINAAMFCLEAVAGILANSTASDETRRYFRFSCEARCLG